MAEFPERPESDERIGLRAIALGLLVIVPIAAGYLVLAARDRVVNGVLELQRRWNAWRFERDGSD